MRALTRLLITVLAFGLGAAGPLGQTRGPGAGQQLGGGTGLIVGRVVEATTNAPVAGALVQLNSNARNGALSVATDSAGQFVLGALPAGAFRLSARRAGYAASALDQRRPGVGEGAIALADGERRADVTIRLWRHGAVTGTVVDEAGEPIIGLPVRAYPRNWTAGRPVLGAAISMGITDDRGIYRLAELVAGEYVIAIIRQLGSTPASLLDEIQRLTESGDRKAAEELTRPLWTAGIPLSPPGLGNTLRIGSAVIELGRPFARSTPDGLLVYPTQYFAAATSVSSARAVSVIPGQDVVGIDFTMRPIRSVQVSGRVVDSNGPVPYFPLRLKHAALKEFENEGYGPGAATVTDAAGRFTFPGVMPGDYVVRGLKGPGGDVGFVHAAGVESSAGGGVVLSGGVFAGDMFEMPTPGPNRKPTLHGSAPISVAERAVDGITVAIRNGVRLTGRFEFSGSAAVPSDKSLADIHLVVDAADGHTTGWDFERSGKGTTDRQFETVELPPGRYFVRVPRPPSGWFLDSIRQGDRDVSDVPLDVADVAVTPLTMRFTDKQSVLSGTVKTSGGESAGDAALVVVFPADRARWVDYGAMPRTFKSTGSGRDGSFELRGLPAGDYFVVAIRDDYLTNWRAPATLAALARTGERVTISGVDKRAVTLTISAGR